jgi:hypothetical protein
MKFTFLILLFVLLPNSVQASELMTIRGTITDSATSQPLKFVTIRAIGTESKATVTSKQGTYLLRLKKGEYTITYSMVGYGSVSKNITIGSKEILLDIKLGQSSFRSAEVIVSAEDPGVKLMRSVIAKKQRWRDSLQRYTYMLYTKFVVSADTLTAGRSSGRNDTSIFSILESYSKGYFSKPDKFFNEIIQKRQTANIPPQANFVAFGTNINIYEDIVSITGEEVFTPFHPDALDFYDFILEGTSIDDGAEIARIRVEPKTGQRRLFSGWLSIHKEQLSPVFVSLIPNRAVKLPFDASFTFEQNFQDFETRYSLPVSLRIYSSLSAEILFLFAPRVDINIETVAYDYVINPFIDPDVFEQRRVEINDKANTFDTAFWVEQAMLPLKKEEEQAYEQIQRAIDDPDSLATSAFNSLLGDVSRFFQQFQRRPFTGFENILRYNRVHGLYTGIGLQFTQSFNAETGLQIGYGWADNKPFLDVFHRQYLDKPKKYFLEAQAYSILARRDNPYVIGVNGINVLSFLFKNDYGDYFYNQGAGLYFEYGWGQLRFLRRDEFIRPSAIRFGIRHERHDPASVNANFALFASDSIRFRGNPTIQSGNYTMLNGEFRYQFTPFRRISTGGFIFTGTHAIEGLSESSFSQATFQTFVRMTTLPLWRLDMRFSGGWSWGDIPPQRFFSLESSIASTAGDGVLRGMNVKEFYGDRFAALSLEHSFGEVIPGVLRIPSIASFGIEFILTGSLGWTDFSQGARLLQALPSTTQTQDKYYYEAGIALNRILLFFRVDFSARMSQRITPEYRFTISSASF